MELQRESVLQQGKYKIERTLGNGGFGITYMATQNGLQRQVAIKEFFMKDFCAREGNSMVVPNPNSEKIVGSCLRKFIREARTVASLNNAHIVRIHDVFEENNTAYYVMELLTRGSLKDKVERSGAIPEDAALDYIAQTAEALYHIHKNKILHLDIKPANIMLNDYNQAVLIDFGISRQIDTAASDTTTSSLGISEGYSPIEQYDSSNAASLKPSTDIYSLGATLLYLLSGQKPPKAADINEHGVPELLNVSERTRIALEKAMSPKRADRFQNVLEFVQAIGRTIHIPIEVKDGDTTFVPARGTGKTEASDNKSSGLRPMLYALGGTLAGMAIFLALFLGIKAIRNHEPKEKPVKTEIVQEKTEVQKAEEVKQEVKEQPAQKTTTPAQTNPAKTSTSTNSTGTIDLGYATYTGPTTNGKPNGYGGTLVFKQSKSYTDLSDQTYTVAVGDKIIDAHFKAGKFILGTWISASGDSKLINIGE